MTRPCSRTRQWRPIVAAAMLLLAALNASGPVDSRGALVVGASYTALPYDDQTGGATNGPAWLASARVNLCGSCR